jgi:hypothetical protein
MFYNRQFLKAVVCILIALVGGSITGGIIALVTIPVFVLDAGFIAAKLNRGQPVRQWEFF